MTILIISLLIYAICGILAYGRTFAYFEHELPYGKITDNRDVAVVTAATGPIGLAVVLIKSWRSGCGWKYTDGCTWVK